MPEICLAIAINFRQAKIILIKFEFIVFSDARTGGPGGPLAPPIFGRSVNPIPTGEGRLSPPITTGTPNVFHLPASLISNTLSI